LPKKSASDLTNQIEAKAQTEKEASPPVLSSAANITTSEVSPDGVITATETVAEKVFGPIDEEIKQTKNIATGNNQVAPAASVEAEVADKNDETKSNSGKSALHSSSMTGEGAEEKKKGVVSNDLARDIGQNSILNPLRAITDLRIVNVRKEVMSQQKFQKHLEAAFCFHLFC